jgi:hypothetical protein
METRPVASLTPTLLARKGAARPAMRPQIQPLRQFHENTARQLDDLGWNDMGGDESDTEALQLPVEPAPQPEAEIVALNPAAEAMIVHLPEVLRQQDDLAARISRPRRSALSDGRRAAFTLRLDTERHLKLRLACVTSNRSAQQIVTDALDRLIAEMPEVAELAAKVRKQKQR